jgi:uncharacterized protein (TIGR00290 family)
MNDEKEKILLSWSGGKDSALAFYQIKKGGIYQISALLTVLTSEYDRISMHGVRKELLEKQAYALGLPLKKVFIKKNITNEEYGKKIKEILYRYAKNGISAVAFGDVNLFDVREYREKNLNKIGMKSIFPLWKKDSLDLANRFIELGFKSIITCVDSKTLDPKFVGRNFDKKLLSEFPSSADSIGENGEFHSFVYEGPIFKEKIHFRIGKIVQRDGRFHYVDLLPQ